MSATPAQATRRTVLIVEDDADLREMLELNLQRAGYRTLTAAGGHAALKLASEQRPDLVLLDRMLPEIEGAEVAARLRSDPALGGLAIIMLTARAQETDELVGLAVGADDYITKPFSLQVLLARIEAVLPRTSRPAAPAPGTRRVRVGSIELDLDAHEAAVDGRPLHLTLTEFRILAALVGAERRVLSRQQLMSAAIGTGVLVTDRTIDVHITAIRKKLGHHGALIQTVRGVGYKASTPQPAPG
jgi:two-component system phosphate regulon response regulator PhoB